MRILLLLLIFTMASSAMAEPVDRVILISVDGLRANLLAALLANDVNGDYTNFQRLIDEGASTLHARTDYSHTVTLPNHTCMITGRPVSQPLGQPATTHHGYTSNSTPGIDDTLHNQGNPALAYVASAFDVAHDHGLSTALYASKSKFIIFDQSYDATNGAPDMIGPDNGRDKIDLYRYAIGGSPSNAAPLHDLLMADLSLGPMDFTFVHYRDPDSAGHAQGWESEGWNSAIAAVDGYLGELLDFVEANPALMGRTVIIVTTDHGGYGTGHSNAEDWRTFTIPFFAWGTDVPAGADLYFMNQASRLYPAGGRPDYNVETAPVRNGDSGNLALSLFGLPAVAGSTINDAQDLSVTRSSSGVPVSAVAVVSDLAAYPNPFNPRTEIHFELASAAAVDLFVYDLSGKLVRTLSRGVSYGSGPHFLPWLGRDDSGRSLASGVYLYRLNAGRFSETKKVVLMK